MASLSILSAQLKRARKFSSAIAAVSSTISLAVSTSLIRFVSLVSYRHDVDIDDGGVRFCIFAKVPMGSRAFGSDYVYSESARISST